MQILKYHFCFGFIATVIAKILMVIVVVLLLVCHRNMFWVCFVPLDFRFCFVFVFCHEFFTLVLAFLEKDTDEEWYELFHFLANLIIKRQYK